MENKKMGQIKSFVNQNRRVIGIVLLVVAVLLSFAFMNKTLEAPKTLVEGCRAGDSFSQTTGKPCTGEEPESCKEGDIYDRNTGKPCVQVEDKSTTPNTNPSSYESALKTYTGKSLLFDASCVSNPSELKAAIGSTVLLANNSEKTLQVSIQTDSAVLRPYHYMKSFISTAGELAVICNGKTSATVNVK
jgi:hypothetical protein